MHLIMLSPYHENVSNTVSTQKLPSRRLQARLCLPVDGLSTGVTLNAPDQVHEPSAGLMQTSKRCELSAQWKGATQSGCSCQMLVVYCCAHCSGSPLAFTKRNLLLMVSICMAVSEVVLSHKNQLASSVAGLPF